MTTANTSIGYGPSHRHRLLFDGDERKYELWEIKFLGFMRIRNLHDVFADLDNEEKVVDDNKNAECFAELVQILDDRSLSLIIRDATDKGREALLILRRHYLPKGKPRIITLYTELTSLIKGDSESVTDYMLRAEAAASALRNADETINDSLLIAMVIKGLPNTYSSFTAVITQKDKTLTFAEFKIALRNHEDTENAQRCSSSSVMNISLSKSKFRHKNNRWCTTCKSSSHDTAFCRKKTTSTASNTSHFKPGRYCNVCKTTSHDTHFCRRFKSAKSVIASANTEHSPSSSSKDKGNDFLFAIGDTSSKILPSDDTFLVDSGSTVHIVKDIDKFVKFDKDFNPEQHILELADGSKPTNVVKGRGDVSVCLKDTDGVCHTVKLENVLYIPSFNQNIFSVKSATDRGASVNFSKDNGFLSSSKSATQFEINKHGNLYFLNCVVSSIGLHEKSSDVEKVCSVRERTLQQWHETMGHCNVRDVIELQKVVDGMKITDVDNFKDFECETCVIGKMTQIINRKPDLRCSNILDRVNIDLAGPVQPVSIDGHKYAMCCVDDYTNLTMCYFLRCKSDAVEAMQNFIADMSPYGTIKSIRTDQGGEFISKEFKKLLRENKIKHEMSSPHSPHQNGTAERAWRTLFGMARCLLLQSNLPKSLWTYATMAAAYIRNRCYSQRIKCTPYELFKGIKPNISNMQPFGTICFAQIQNPQKLSDRSERGIFIGFDKGSPAHLVYFPENQVVKKIRVVKFKKFVCNSQQNDEKVISEQPMILEDCVFQKTDNDKQIPLDNNQCETAHTSGVEPSTTIQTCPVDDMTSTSSIEPKRQRSRPKHLNDFYVHDEVDDVLNVTVHYCYNVSNVHLPTSYKDAITSSDSYKWKSAMEDEMHALRENDTFKVTRLPENRAAIGGRWVYTLKTGPNGEPKHKARFVAKGYSQMPGIDYDETFSPTARISSVRTMIQYAVQNDITIHQMDVKSAYLNAPIDCELYVKQPEGYEIEGEINDNLVLKLNKSLYGLKQSGRNWNNLLHSFLIEKGFKQSQVDPCVYNIHSGSYSTVMLCYVDDILLMSNSDCLLTEFKGKLSERFRMTDLGQISSFLGIEFNHENDSIMMHQTTYLNKLLSRFDMQNCKPKYTPCDMNINKFENESAVVGHGGGAWLVHEERGETNARLYREIVGGLIYAMTCTRPDLSFAVTKLSQHMSAPTAHHMTMAKHTLRYIKATVDRPLIFRKSEKPLKLIGFCDSDWANSKDRKSVSGYSFQLTNEGPLISWKSKKQSTVALSTCEAEYISLSSATQEGIFLLALFNDIAIMTLNEFEINCDNQSAISIAKNPVLNQRTKHIDIKYHFLRNMVQDKKMLISYVPSEHNVADALTKPMSRMKIDNFKFIAMGHI